MNRILIPILSLVLVASVATGSRIANLPVLAAHSAILAIDKSLVEREQERIEADCATPESSPSATPFSLSRPMLIVSNVAVETAAPSFSI